jgi:hypothetical protein
MRYLSAIVMALLLASVSFPANGQERPRTKSKAGAKASDIRSTTVEIVLLADGGLQSQQWLSALEPLNISVTIRRGTGTDKIETTEKMYGKIRSVTAVGQLERNGRIVFADRAFDMGDRQKIKEWVGNLQTFGAQGSPEGQPLWGLTDDQFNEIYQSLTEPTTTDPRGEPLEKAVQALPLPGKYAVRWTDAAQKRLNRSGGKSKVRQSTQGFAVATALAILLNDHGLGFRPTRSPAGDLELVIDVPDKPGDVWPIGWPLKLPRQKAAPKLFALQQVFFEDISLEELLSKAAQAAEIPVLFDHADLERQGIDWESLKISYPPRQATWHTVMRDGLNKAKLSYDLWQDEAGQPFLYVTSLKSKRHVPIEK